MPYRQGSESSYPAQEREMPYANPCFFLSLRAFRSQDEGDPIAPSASRCQERGSEL